jgi:ornithine cyclodeaminase/alanine dehydrogenase
MSTDLYARRDIERALDLADAYEAVRRTYVETARGRVLNPSKLTMHLGDDGEWPNLNAFSIDMPAYVDWLEVVGMKWAIATWNSESDSPISSQILLFDIDDEEFTAIMEGMYLTGVRTALQTVVGLDRLSPAAAASVGVVGAGYQARFQLSVVDALLDVETFRLFDTDGGRARELAAAVGPRLDARIEVADAAGDVVGCDAVVTVTDSKVPVLEEAWLDEGTFLVALGSYRELPDETVRAADHLVVDHVEQCLQRGALADMAERGELARGDVDATVGEVLAGEYERPVASGDRVLFVPIGLGALDVAVAERLRRSDGDAGGSFPFA